MMMWIGWVDGGTTAVEPRDRQVTKPHRCEHWSRLFRALHSAFSQLQVLQCEYRANLALPLRYSEGDTEKLKACQSLHGNDWKKIGALVARSSLSVALKFSQIRNSK